MINPLNILLNPKIRHRFFLKNDVGKIIGVFASGAVHTVCTSLPAKNTAANAVDIHFMISAVAGSANVESDREIG
jgi:hypothetical protein